MKYIITIVLSYGAILLLLVSLTAPSATATELPVAIPRSMRRLHSPLLGRFLLVALTAEDDAFC